MARVNVEDGALPRIAKLAGLMGVSDREAAGTVYMLWRDSQDVLACEGTREDMIDWGHLYGMDEAEAERWLHALERARFITRLDDGLYRIHGNEVQIGGRISRLHKGCKGAEATKKKWESLQAGPKQAPSTLVPQQSNPIQSKPVQSSAVGGGPPPPADEDSLSPELKPEAMKALATAFGEGLVARELPKATAAWILEPPYRRRSTTFGSWARHWLQNIEKDEKNAARAGPRADIDTVALITKREAGRGK